MTIIATVRQDRIAGLLVTATPASYFDMPAWAAKLETRELPGTLESLLPELEEGYVLEYLGSYETPQGDNYDRYRLTPHPIGADGHPIRPEAPAHH